MDPGQRSLFASHIFSKLGKNTKFCRDFFACPQDQSMKCKYFQWADELGKPGAKPFQPASQGGAAGIHCPSRQKHLEGLFSLCLCFSSIFSSTSLQVLEAQSLIKGEVFSRHLWSCRTGLFASARVCLDLKVSKAEKSRTQKSKLHRSLQINQHPNTGTEPAASI